MYRSATGAAASSPPGLSVHPAAPPPALPGSWTLASRLIAAGSIVVLAMRTDLPQGLTVGFVLCCALLPVWFQTLRLFRGALSFLFLGIITVLAGVLLTQFSASNHSVSSSEMFSYSFLLLGLVFGVGLVLWGRRVLSDAAVSVWFGIGLMLGVSPGTASFASNPWRFGFSVAVTVLVLGLAQLSGRRWIELVALAVLTLTSGLTDARSSFAILLLTALLVAWQMRPRSSSRRGSAFRAVLAVGALAFVVYNLGQAFILEGFLGQATQQRSQAQIDASGSLILGGRPELAATASLMNSNPWGFGSGVHANLQDILAAKSGMIAIGYQPDNGYVERYMFGTGFELHSVIGDLWANFGIAGVVFALYLVFIVLRALGTALSTSTASAALLYLGIKTLWNLMFAPLYSSVPLMILLLALAFSKRTLTAEPEGTPVSSQKDASTMVAVIPEGRDEIPGPNRGDLSRTAGGGTPASSEVGRPPRAFRRGRHFAG